MRRPGLLEATRSGPGMVWLPNAKSWNAPSSGVLGRSRGAFEIWLRGQNLPGSVPQWSHSRSAHLLLKSSRSDHEEHCGCTVRCHGI